MRLWCQPPGRIQSQDIKSSDSAKHKVFDFHFHTALGLGDIQFSICQEQCMYVHK